LISQIAISKDNRDLYAQRAIYLPAGFFLSPQTAITAANTTKTILSMVRVGKAILWQAIVFSAQPPISVPGKHYIATVVTCRFRANFLNLDLPLHNIQHIIWHLFYFRLRNSMHQYFL